eukprot:scaffold23951_cov103-Skeletonema_menzelii.AAC.1
MSMHDGGRMYVGETKSAEWCQSCGLNVACCCHLPTYLLTHLQLLIAITITINHNHASIVHHLPPH